MRPHPGLCRLAAEGYTGVSSAVQWFVPCPNAIAFVSRIGRIRCFNVGFGGIDSDSLGPIRIRQ